MREHVASADDVLLAALHGHVLEQIDEQLVSNLLVLQAAQFADEFVVQDRDAGSSDSCCGGQVEDLVFSGDGVRDDLPDRVAKVALSFPSPDDSRLAKSEFKVIKTL